MRDRQEEEDPLLDRGHLVQVAIIQKSLTDFTRKRIKRRNWRNSIRNRRLIERLRDVLSTQITGNRRDHLVQESTTDCMRKTLRKLKN
jgi:hypothetical protein